MLTLGLALPAAGTAARRADGGPGVTVTQTLTGLNQDTGGGYAPPDVQVAAGPGFVVETVNLAIEIWRTSGSAPVAVSTRSLADFFSSAADLTDPRILYDALSKRWFASISDLGGSVLLAVSRGGDPTGAWNLYSFDAGGACPDQPRLGVAGGVVVLGADLFSGCGGSFARALGAELWIVSKAQLLGGDASPDFTTFGPTRSYSSLTPVQSLSPTAVEYVVGVDEPASTVVHVLAVTGTPPAGVSVRETATPAISPLLPPPDAVEPDAAGAWAADVKTNDDRILDAAWENGRLWFSADGGCIPSGDVQSRACGRVAELATAGGTVTWQTDLSVPGAYVFFPAIRPDASGDLVVVYGQSSASSAPDVRVVARTPDGTWTAPAVVARSGAPAGSRQNDGRWGDYFGAARDPADPSVVWVAGETGPAGNGSLDWTTALGSVVVTGTGGTPPAAAAVPPPPGVRARATSGHAGKRVRLSYLALDDGDAVRVQVTVRSAASVLFRKTTVAGALAAQHVYGVDWTPPRRLRGSFRFCVHTLASDGTSSAESCATLRLR